MALSDALSAVQDTITALNPTLGITFNQGGQYKFSKTSPPNIVWIPTTDRFAPPDPQGPIPSKTSSPARALRTRVVGIEAWIWGQVLDQTKPFDETERLMHSVIDALFANLRGASFELVSGEWSGQDGAEMLQLGRLYILRFTIRVPVLDAPLPAITTVVLTSEQQTDQMRFPNSTFQEVP